MTSTEDSVGTEAEGRSEPQQSPISGEGGEPDAWRIRRPMADAGFGRPQVFTTDDASDGDLKQWRRNGYEVQPLYSAPPVPSVSGVE